MSKSLAKEVEGKRLVAGCSTGKSLADIDIQPVLPKKVLPGAFKPTTRLQKRGGKRGFRSHFEAMCADMCMQMRFAREIKQARAKQERKNNE